MGKKETQRKVAYLIIGLVSIGIIIALIWRIQCSISYYDEVFNIYVSYRTVALGQRHLIENDAIFAMGDLFNLPFVFLFYKLTGGMNGILLFIRFVYLGINLIVAGIFWRAFRKKLGDKIALLFGLIFITFWIGGMYTVSYDSISLCFSLVGGFLLLGAETKEKGVAQYWRFGAGICHGCMVYAYPLMLLVIIFLLIGVTAFRIKKDKARGQEIWKYWLPYFLGGLVVIGTFVIYVLSVGWKNIFFFQTDVIENQLEGRVIEDLTTNAQDGMLKGIFSQIYSLLNYMWMQQRAALVYTLFLLIQWGIGLAKKGWWRYLLIPEIILVAFFTHIGDTDFSGTTMFAYCFCWAPFLYFYLDKEEKKEGQMYLLVLGSTAVASFFAIGFTSVRTDKAHVGLYCGAICTFLFMAMILHKWEINHISVSIPFVLLISLCTITMAYVDHFQGADIVDCTYRVQTGVFKGMRTWEQDVEFEKLSAELQQERYRNAETIWFSHQDYYVACLEGKLFASGGASALDRAENILQRGEQAETVYILEEWPDVILLAEENADNYANVEQMILAKYYELTLSEQSYSLYVRKI